MQDPEKKYFLYRTKRDSRVRPDHAQWEGLLIKKTDPLVEKIMPQNGHNCRCAGIFLTAAEAKAEKKTGTVTTKKPKLEYVSYIDTATGKRMRTLKGVDPGWMGKPGDNAEDLAKLLERSLLRLAQKAQAAMNS